MSEQCTLTKNAFEKLIKEFTSIEEQKDSLINEYFPEPSIQRNDFKQLMKEYIHQVNNFIKNICISSSSKNTIPFVTIGSIVDLHDLEDDQSTKLRIVLPFQNEENYDASCLSPFGKVLLLKKIDDKVSVKTPGGIFRYKINCITLPSP